MRKSIILMLTYINLTLLLSFPATPVIAQANFWEQTNGPGGNIRSLAINSNGDIFAGTTLGGVFRSTDNGDNWSPINTGLTTTAVLALAINGSGEIFVGTFSGGVFRSSDNGDNWSAISVGLTNTNVGALSINSNGDIFAGGWRRVSLHRQRRHLEPNQQRLDQSCGRRPGD